MRLIAVYRDCLVSSFISNGFPVSYEVFRTGFASLVSDVCQATDIVISYHVARESTERRP